MGRGDRPKVRWKHDRIRRKHRRAARTGAARSEARDKAQPAS